MAECLFLTHLPAEIRLRVYENVLAFEKPLKLRQVVAGSKNTGILRANHKIYSEALPVFYDINTIMVTRNDFCLDTDPDLQTPLRRDQVRHLLVKNFSQSIRCSSFSGGANMYLPGCCDVCKPDATEFIATVASLPRIQTVTIDYHHHQREFGFIKDNIRGIGSTSIAAEHGFSIECVGKKKYVLKPIASNSTAVITFVDLPFNTIWTALEGHERAFTPTVSPTKLYYQSFDSMIDHLRNEVDRELSDKLGLGFSVLQCKLHTLPISDNAEESTEAIVEFAERLCKHYTAEQARELTSIIRADESMGMQNADCVIT